MVLWKTMNFRTSHIFVQAQSFIIAKGSQQFYCQSIWFMNICKIFHWVWWVCLVANISSLKIIIFSPFFIHGMLNISHMVGVELFEIISEEDRREMLGIFIHGFKRRNCCHNHVNRRTLLLALSKERFTLRWDLRDKSRGFRNDHASLRTNLTCFYGFLFHLLLVGEKVYISFLFTLY